MRRLSLFAKRPVLGQVKTRLVPPLRAEQALALYRAFVVDQISFLRSLGDEAATELRLDGAWPLDLGPAPPGGRPTLREQGPGDLGERLLRAFVEADADGAGCAVAIGADAPTLPRALVLGAFAILESGAEAVVSPAADGGYVLLGMQRPIAELLRDVPWGGPEVLRVTLERARSARVDLRLAQGWYDVDEFADVRRMATELAGPAAARAPETARCLRALGLDRAR